ncbi:MAG: GvpL/GvpF family gas vesicle protein [Gemmatimonadaceae bacterium]
MARTRSQRNPAIGADALQLFGVVALDPATPSPAVDEETLPLRDLAAIVRDVPYKRLEASSSAIVEYRSVVEGRFRERPVVPAPFGTVFKSRDSLLHWMELHYVTLMGALSFLGDRLMTRVKVATRPLLPHELSASGELRATDFETTVFDSFRFLKRSSVGCVTFAPHETPRHGDSLDASFLVEREQWTAFSNAVGEERRRLPELDIEQSGPWPPYDFVRLQFGA